MKQDKEIICVKRESASFFVVGNESIFQTLPYMPDKCKLPRIACPPHFG